MGKTIIEKVAVCNTNGELEIAPAFFIEMVDEYMRYLDELCSSPEGLADALSFAIFCRENGAERDAISILHKVWRGTHLVTELPTPLKEELQDGVRREVSILYFSNDEYVWEASSQFF